MGLQPDRPSSCHHHGVRQPNKQQGVGLQPDRPPSCHHHGVRQPSKHRHIPAAATPLGPPGPHLPPDLQPLTHYKPRGPHPPMPPPQRFGPPGPYQQPDLQPITPRFFRPSQTHLACHRHGVSRRITPPLHKHQHTHRLLPYPTHLACHHHGVRRLPETCFHPPAGDTPCRPLGPHPNP